MFSGSPWPEQATRRRMLDRACCWTGIAPGQPTAGADTASMLLEKPQPSQTRPTQPSQTRPAWLLTLHYTLHSTTLYDALRRSTSPYNTLQHSTTLYYHTLHLTPYTLHLTPYTLHTTPHEHSECRSPASERLCSYSPGRLPS